MSYEISYEVNGVSGNVMVNAKTPEEALDRFRAEWSEHGDEPPLSPWISGTWSNS